MFAVNEDALQEYGGVGSPKRYRLSAKEKQRQRNRARYMTEDDRQRTYASVRNWAKSNPDRYAEIRQQAQVRYRLRKFGLTIEQYVAMLEAQGNCCAICKGQNYVRTGTQGPKSKGAGWPTTKQQQNATVHWHVDHDHKTGKVRGLLCTTCNIALGAAKDDPSLLRLMAEYLER